MIQRHSLVPFQLAAILFWGDPFLASSFVISTVRSPTTTTTTTTSMTLRNLHVRGAAPSDLISTAMTVEHEEIVGYDGGDGSDGSDDDRQEQLRVLFDKSICLFPTSNNDSNDNVKEREIMVLVEEIALSMYGIDPMSTATTPAATPAAAAPTTDSASTSVQVPPPSPSSSLSYLDTDLTSIQDLTVAQLSQSLDQVILQGYQSTFGSDALLEEWVSCVEQLSNELDKRLKEINNNNEQDSPSLINVNDRMQPGINNRDKKDDVSRFMKRYEQLLSSMDTPVPTISEKDAAKAIEYLDAQVMSGIMPELSQQQQFLAGITTPTAATTLAANSTTTITDSAKQTEQGDLELQSINTTMTSKNATEVEDRTADVVSAVVAAAALGAVAITKIPLFAAGAALGPLVSQSIAYARLKSKEYGAQMRAANKNMNKNKNATKIARGD